MAKAKSAAEIGAAAAVETAETVSISAATAIVIAIGIASTKALTRDRAWSLLDLLTSFGEQYHLYQFFLYD